MGAQAFVLAAGRGARLRPLTDATPKPLLVVGGRRLIEWHLLALAAAGVREVVVNVAWLADQFEPALGDGRRYGLRIRWSREDQLFGSARETAGGIRAALDALDECFWVVSADVWLPGFAFAASERQSFAASVDLARLWLAPNAPHHPSGDFVLAANGRVVANGSDRLTWASVGLFRRALFEEVPWGGALPLRPLLDAALQVGRLGGRALVTPWVDVGNVERLALVRGRLEGRDG